MESVRYIMKNNTSLEDHRKELKAYTDQLCKKCYYNYMLADEYGIYEYCPVTDIYTEKMLQVRECDHYRRTN